MDPFRVKNFKTKEHSAREADPVELRQQLLLRPTNENLNKIDKYITKSLDQKIQIYDKENETLRAITQQLQNFKRTQKIKENDYLLKVQQISEQSHRLEKEISDLRDQQGSKIQTYNQQIQEIKSQLKDLCVKRLQVAQQVDCKALGEIVIKNVNKQTILNELFKWYDGQLLLEQFQGLKLFNSKEEVFVNDKGYDFKERLGKVKAIDMKRDEITKTDLLLTIQENILGEQFLNEAQKNSLTLIFQAIRLIQQIYLKGEEIHKIEKIIQSFDGENDKIQLEIDILGKRRDILVERVQQIQRILKFHRDLQVAFEQKFGQLQTIPQLNEKFTRDLKEQYEQVERDVNSSGQIENTIKCQIF